ncbi:MAG: ABC transporter substrate-binding protein [Clostridiales bacterium]|nr:ABC transporter substrate-binding protein [Clostridiales bacterium]
MKKYLSIFLTVLLLLGSFTTALAQEWKESPLLAEQVAAGELPPVEERLPLEPYVSKAEEIGIYGGTFRGAGFGPTHGQLDTEGMRMIGLLRLLPDATTVEPFILKDFEVNEDFTKYTLSLREGMKWSDGAPFTADDFVFWYETIGSDADVAALLGIINAPMWETAKIEKADDYTVLVVFEEPSPSFQVKMQKGGLGQHQIWAPKHYLEQYHINYNDKAEAIAKEEGHASWQIGFAEHAKRGQDSKDYGPDLAPFVLYNIDTDGNKYYKRNPYYFVVDKEGNQLPYIDEQMTVIVADSQTRTLKLINGELDAAGENPLPVSDYTLYKENEEKGNYNCYLFDNSRGSDSAFTFTQTIKDETLHSLFTNVTFREAMSLAIDRDVINETLYFGLAAVRQAIPPANTSFYEEWMEDYMANYDPEGAAQRLDDLGCTMGADGIRQMPDGRPFNLILESTEEFAPVGEMVSEMWTDIGVKTTFKQQERSYARERYFTNERETQVFTFDNVAEPSLYAERFDKMCPPFGNSEIGQAPLWAEWFTSKGEKGEEPPAEIIELREKIYKFATLPQGSEEYLALGNEILTFMVKELYFIGTTVAPRVIILNKDLGNAPTEGIFANDYNFWYPFNCDAWYFKNN